MLFLLCIMLFIFLLIVFIVCYFVFVLFLFFSKQKTAYDMRSSDWSSDVCSSDLDPRLREITLQVLPERRQGRLGRPVEKVAIAAPFGVPEDGGHQVRPAYAIGGRVAVAVQQPHQRHAVRGPIGRASCRERVCPYV